MNKSLRIGTRKSALALHQAQTIQRQISAAYPNQPIEIVPIVTSGDTQKNIPLDQLGGKGVFIKELELALLDHTIDIAVHCLKDVTSSLPDSLVLSGFVAADYVADVLVACQPVDLNQSLRIGTSSQRRQRLLSYYYPQLTFQPIRGNIDTRLARLSSGDYDAIVLSQASLKRLGIDTYWEHVFPVDSFVPAPGQGVLVLQTRKDDTASSSIAAAMGCPTQHIISEFEYQLMQALTFNCDIPLGIHSQLCDDLLKVRVCVAQSSTSDCYFHRYEIPIDQLSTAILTIQTELQSWIAS